MTTKILLIATLLLSAFSTFGCVFAPGTNPRVIQAVASEDVDGDQRTQSEIREAQLQEEIRLGKERVKLAEERAEFEKERRENAEERLKEEQNDVDSATPGQSKAEYSQPQAPSRATPRPRRYAQSQHYSKPEYVEEYVVESDDESGDCVCVCPDDEAEDEDYDQ